jgi:hypothetical protein
MGPLLWLLGDRLRPLSDRCLIGRLLVLGDPVPGAGRTRRLQPRAAPARGETAGPALRSVIDVVELGYVDDQLVVAAGLRIVEQEPLTFVNAPVWSIEIPPLTATISR